MQLLRLPLMCQFVPYVSCAYVPELVAVYCANVAAVYGPAIAVLMKKLLSGASASKVAQEMPSVIRSLGKAFA